MPTRSFLYSGIELYLARKPARTDDMNGSGLPVGRPGFLRVTVIDHRERRPALQPVGQVHHARDVNVIAARGLLAERDEDQLFVHEIDGRHRHAWQQCLQFLLVADHRLHRLVRP